MFGRVPGGPALPWEWAEARLRSNHTYWVTSVTPARRPHARPVWGVWLQDGFAFSTASRSLRYLAASAPCAVHLPDAEAALIVEGAARVVTAPGELAAFVDAYNAKYDWDFHIAGTGVADSLGNAGSVLRVEPRRVYGWERDLETATRWRFGNERQVAPPLPSPTLDR